MKHKINLLGLQYLMLGVNIVACIFSSAVILASSSQACISGRGAELLYSVGRVPWNPKQLFIYTCLLCTAMFMTFVTRQLVSRHVRLVTTITIICDSLVNVIIIFITDFNSNAFILWILANIIYQMKGKRTFIIMAAGSFVYMICSYDLISVYIPLFSVRNYFLFYDRSVQQRLFFVYYMMHDLNFLCFVIFCMEVIRRQKSTIEEIRSLYAKLKKANIELKEYADIKEQMGETRERNRLAMEIHDTVGHSLTGISVGVDTCLAIMDANPKAAKVQLSVISKVAKEGIADIRRSVRALQGDDQSSSLSSQISEMLEKTRLATGIIIRYRCTATLSLDADESKTVFRVIQESVTNAIRHGHAGEIDVQISEQEGKLIMLINDNGCGCKNFECGFGTTHMKERLAMLGGTIDFYSQEGFTVKAIMPVRATKTKENVL